MLICELEVEGCDATKFNHGTKAGNKIINLLL